MIYNLLTVLRLVLISEGLNSKAEYRRAGVHHRIKAIWGFLQGLSGRDGLRYGHIPVAWEKSS